MDEVSAFTDIIAKGGLVGLLAFIIWAGIKKVWVFGWHYEEAREFQRQLMKERDEWKDLALRGTTLSERATAIAEKKGNPG